MKKVDYATKINGTAYFCNFT